MIYMQRADRQELNCIGLSGTRGMATKGILEGDQSFACRVWADNMSASWTTLQCMPCQRSLPVSKADQYNQEAAPVGHSSRSSW